MSSSQESRLYPDGIRIEYSSFTMAFHFLCHSKAAGQWIFGLPSRERTIATIDFAIPGKNYL